MRHTAAEKYETIRLVEGSDLSVRQTLRELRVNRSTFYAWYRRYTQRGRAGLEPQSSTARRIWNRIPPSVRQRVVAAALADPEQSLIRLLGAPSLASKRWVYEQYDQLVQAQTVIRPGGDAAVGVLEAVRELVVAAVAVQQQSPGALHQCIHGQLLGLGQGLQRRR